MKEPDHFGETLPEGVQLSLSELREMACRQQAQIDSQQQLLAAKEQRLRYLKDQDARQQRVQAETERLRRLKERVDAQELKLRKLRALRGQVDHHKQNNISLTSDLESIRALFNEKEKELSLAVAKVEELTRQLEELRRGRNQDDTPPAAALELDKLRRELMYRNKLNEQQNQRLNQQREALAARQEEMSNIDKRISELQERLHRKRLLNQQLANQISAASNKAAYHQFARLTGNVDQTNQCYNKKSQPPNQQPPNGLSKNNIAAVEPYNHVPLPISNNYLRNIHCGIQDNQQTYHPVYQHNQINGADQQQQTNNHKSEHINQQQDSNNKGAALKTTEDGVDTLKEFSVSKSDPKYQTLPYNTKFTVSLVANRTTNNMDNNNFNEGAKDVPDAAVQHISSATSNINLQSHHMTVHSAPLNVVNKNIATPLSQNDLINKKHEYQSSNGNNCVSNTDIIKNVPVGSTASYSMPIPTLHSYQKPISSVAPTSVHHAGKLSNIYQTSSMKVQPVEPQTVTSNSKQFLSPPNHLTTTIQSPQLGVLSPPQANSTPLGTPEVSLDKSIKPALPPKPAIKPPPRQTTQIHNESDFTTNNIEKPPEVQNIELSHRPPPPPTTQSSKSLNQKVPLPPHENQQQTQYQASENLPIIKAKPLQIKKQPLSEQPKLRSMNMTAKTNGYLVNNRRMELPPQYHSPETTNHDNKSIELIKHSTQEEDKQGSEEMTTYKENDSSNNNKDELKSTEVIRRCKKGNLKQTGKVNLSRRVSFDPLALLLDASLEGELELVKKTASQVPNPSAANDEGITALHNAICAGHFEIVKFLVEFGCDVNAQDSDGWTPLHCAASCNNVAMVKFLVEHGACIFATTLSDHETAAEKCEEDEEGFDGCSEYLYSVQEKLGILSGGSVYAVFDYTAQQPDELSFTAGQQLTVIRKGDEYEREWWWCRLDDKEGYVPRNLLGLHPRVSPRED
ncbi:apoptosis-stimulating of p53 protein 2 isoform X2 [Agrilus planipennis]|uniref:Apoptosis-stimulating of p53 protein 2 isoform X2 n=1 Tax=Agrilus planipennis TaxID=224129 RepID=A0A1W4WGU1_AGRPL|nr:apoptosis-stimulating of p53 protein 2 isoform X2 [Agrilus planipennis]